MDLRILENYCVDDRFVDFDWELVVGYVGIFVIIIWVDYIIFLGIV